MDTHALLIRVLGPLEIHSRIGILSLSEKQAALLGILAATEGAEMSRSTLATWLWPRSGLRSARHSLSQCLYGLRRIGLDQVLRVSSRSVALTNGTRSDYRTFAELYSNDEWLRAAEQIRGPFLQDVSTRSDGLDEFIQRTRRVLLGRITSVSHRLCEAFQFEEALRLARVALDQDPFERDAVQVVVQSLTGLNKASEAKAFASHARKAWRDQLGEDIVIDVPAYEVPGAGDGSMFVGRQLEIRSLARSWDIAKAGRFHAAFIVGEAGIGKTALARRFQRLVALRGGRTLWAVGSAAEQNVPFGIFEQWLYDVPPDNESDGEVSVDRLIAATFPRLPPELEPLEVGRQRIHAALAAFLARAAASNPLCLFVDDMQWGDDASLAFVHYLSRYHSSLPVMLVSTFRPEFSPPLARDLESAETLSLQPLSLEDSTRLIELKSNVLGRFPLRYSVDQIHHRTGGNPLLIISLLADGALLRDLGEEIPSSVVEFLLPRMAKLSTTAKVILAALGIVPDSSRETLPAIVDVGISECEDAIQELLRVNLVDSQHASVRARHGLSAELALTLLPPLLERQLRGRTARILEQGGQSSAAVLAPQFDVSGQHERAYVAALKAASAAVELFAHKEAEFFYKLALSNSVDEGNSAEVRLSLANLFLATGRKDDARLILRPIDANSLEESIAVRVRVLREIAALSGAIETAAIKRGQQLLCEIQVELFPDLAARLALAVASAAHTQGDLSGILEECTLRAVELIQDVPDVRTRVGIAVRVGALIAMSESYDDGLSQINGVASEATLWPDTLAAFLGARGSAYVAAGRLLEAEQDFLKAAELMERTGTYESISMVANNLGVCYQEQGRLNDAAKQYEMALSIRERLDAPSWVQITYDNLGILLFEKEDYEAGIELANEGLTTAKGSASFLRSFVSHQSIKGLCCLALGRRIEARECRREIQLARTRGGFWSNDVSYIEIFMARMSAIDGEVDPAIERLQKCVRLYTDKDFLGSRRMEIELLRLKLPSNPDSVLSRCLSLRDELAPTGATRMVAAIDALITRAQGKQH